MVFAGIATALSDFGGGALSAGLSHAGLGLALGQDGEDNKLTIFVGIAAFSMLLQVLLLVGAGIGALVAVKKVTAEIEVLKSKMDPLLAKGQEIAGKASQLTSDLTPTIKNITTKVDTVAGHGAEISAMVKSKVEEFGPTITKANETLLSANQTVMDATAKTHEQLLRVNEMISNTLDATEKAGKRMVHNVTQPGREIAGLATGVRVAVQTFFDRQNREPRRSVRSDDVVGTGYEQRSSRVSDALSRDRRDDIGL